MDSGTNRILNLKTKQQFEVLLEGEIKNVESNLIQRHDLQSTNQQSGTECNSDTQKILSFQQFILDLIVEKPKLFDDQARDKVTDFYKLSNVKVHNLLELENLEKLTKSQYQSLSWIVYEALLISLIKKQLYEPKVIADELLDIVKSDIKPELGSKLTTLLKSCVPHCRRSGCHSADEEEEEKWCEIIEWMSWAVTDEEGQL